MAEAPAKDTRPFESRYELGDRLGEGGQGEVWRAHDRTRGVDVALKILKPPREQLEPAWSALVREHATTSALSHPAVLKTFPPERSGDLLLLPMELATGGDLRRLRGAGYLEIVPVLLEVAHALEHAHERGVVHRDLKPGNVLFDARGRVRLADFGISASLSQEPGGTVSAGLSPFTASPEQLRGEPPSPADDIYGLGALAYELLSGYPPYYPRFEARARGEPMPELVPTRQIPPVLARLVRRMLAPSAGQRPRSMREVIDELDAALNDTLTFELQPLDAPAAPVEVRPPPAVRTPTPEVRKSAAEVPERAPLPRPTPPAAPRPLPEAPTANPPREVRAPDPVRAAAAAVAPAAQPATRSRAAAVSASAAGIAAEATLSAQARAPWEDLRLEPLPRVARLEPMRKRRSPVVILGLLVGVAAAFYWFPQYVPRLTSLPLATAPSLRLPSSPSTSPAPSLESAAEAPERVPGEPAPGVQPARDAQPARTVPQPARPGAESEFAGARQAFARHLATLERRGAGVWGGTDFAAAKARAAESVGAHDAGDMQLADQRLAEAEKLLTQVDAHAREASARQLEAGDKALAAGQQGLALQAYGLALRIDPGDRRAQQGEQRARRLGGVLPLLADAQNAEHAGDYSRAAQDYSQALALDPESAAARSGLVRANTSFGQDSYAKAVGAGFAALGAGRLDEARADFNQARALRPNGGPEAADGLRRVQAALAARDFAVIRQRAAALEAAERWDEALEAYQTALRSDPSLLFAQQGKVRAARRADLARSLKAVIDHPERLGSPGVKAEAAKLLSSARTQYPAGPELRSQIARLEQLLPEFDRPVHLALVSDNATQVAIPSIGAFGTFARRDIELKPGKYTVVGTRSGYRDVRRDITVAPGQASLTVSVSCSEPI